MEARSPFLAGNHPLLVSVAAGLIAGAVTGGSDRLLDRFVTLRQKLRDRMVRKAPAHRIAGPYLAEKILNRSLSKQGKQRAHLAFSLAYGAGWGLLYGGLRTSLPGVRRLAGLPFAIPFFFACDGLMAPLLGISPGLRRIPWQPNAKELANHVVWTATAEMVHRAVGAARQRAA